MIPKKTAITFALLLVGARMSGQETSSPTQPKSLRSPVLLLEGYKYQRTGVGLEGGKSGKIWKDGGVTIDYDEGIYNENEAAAVKPKEILWRNTQFINNRRLECVYTKSHEFVATLQASTNFSAKIRNQQELADMLLMVVTFKHEGYPLDSVPGPPTPKN